MHAASSISVLCLALVATVSPLAAEPAATALYLDRMVEIENVLEDPTDLWVSPQDLERINDFVLKAEGACLGDLCVPVRQDEDSAIFVHRHQEPWINVSELANRVQQASAFDAENRVWSFGQVPATRSSFLSSAVAPDFELPDRQGNKVRLSDYRGKKVLLLTWASW